jgi:hypothetical protein
MKVSTELILSSPDVFTIPYLLTLEKQERLEKRKDIIKSLWSLTQQSLLILLLRDLITFALLLFFASITLRCRRGRSSSNIPINRQTKLLTDLQVTLYFYLRVFMFLILLRQVALTFYGRIVLEFILTEFMCSLV